MSHKLHDVHESTAAACEVFDARTGKPRGYGKIAVAKAYEEMLAVYRMHGTDTTCPTRLLEVYSGPRYGWISAERRLQRLALEQMVRYARTVPNSYRVVVFDYAGRRVVLDTANVHIREGR